MSQTGWHETLLLDRQEDVEEFNCSEHSQTSHATAGFTLAELLVATALSVLVIGGVIVMMLAQYEAYWRQSLINEMRQNSRAAASFLVRDIRLAGYGLPVPQSDVPSWINWMSGVSDHVTVTQGTNTTPDQLTLVGAFEGPVSSFKDPTSAGDTVIKVEAGTQSTFASTNSRVIFIGKLEVARVISQSGINLTISTSPTATGEGLANAYPANTPIELVQAITYSCDLATNNFPYRPFLMRDDNMSTFSNNLEKMTAIGIDDFQITTNSNGVTANIRAISKEQDYDHTDSSEGDHFWRTTMTASAKPRNP